MNRILLPFVLLLAPLPAADGPTVRYACPDGEGFTVQYQPEKTTPRGTRNPRAVLLMQGKPRINLPHVEAASGAKYSDGYTTLWSQGEQAMLESGSVNVSGCTAQTGSEALLDGRWLLSSRGDDSPVRPKGAAFVEFSPSDQRAFGVLGCNRFSGSVDLNDPELAFRGIAVTKMACRGPVMDLESRFLLALETTASYRIDAEHLMLQDAVGNTIAKLIKE